MLNTKLRLLAFFLTHAPFDQFQDPSAVHSMMYKYLRPMFKLMYKLPLCPFTLNNPINILLKYQVRPQMSYILLFRSMTFLPRIEAGVILSDYTIQSIPITIFRPHCISETDKIAI